MKQFVQNEEAVSPVIGVILMVAITVILAAVIAAFVFGMAGNVQSTKSVAATATQQGDIIYVTYQGGPDTNQVASINITWPNGTPTGNTTPLVVGTSWNATGTSGRDHVVVAATFVDGSSQVILDTYV